MCHSFDITGEAEHPFGLRKGLVRYTWEGLRRLYKGHGISLKAEVIKEPRNAGTG